MVQAWETYFSSSRPLVMGILNLTSDSFFPGSRIPAGNGDELSGRITAMLSQGADILDLGAESSRPGSVPVSEQDEITRLIPAVRLARQLTGMPISVDTRRPRVARLALQNGADIINDITAAREDGEAMLSLAAETQAPLILMHMQGEPSNMQRNPHYQDVISEVSAWLAQRVQAARAAGVRNLLVDPGIGFGKTVAHNLRLLASCREIAATTGCPLLVGHSRKNFIGQILAAPDPHGQALPRPVEGRLAGSLAAAAWCVLEGVAVIRTHDVAETADLIKVIEAIRASREAPHV